MLSRTCNSVRTAALRANARSQSVAATAGPLTEQFPGLGAPNKTALPVPGPQVTTLKNGLKVASYDTNDLATTVGVVVGMGTRHESASTAGACHLLKYAAYGATENRTGLRLVRDLEDLGAQFGVAHGRETFTLSAKCMRNKLNRVVDAMAETLRQPTMKIWELKARANAMIDDTAANGNSIDDALHAAAFYDSETLGQPLYSTTARLYDAEELGAFRDPLVVPSNMVVVGTATSHTDLVKAVEQQFGDMASGSAPAPATAEYVGGESRVAAAGATTVGVVFPVPAGSAAASKVLAEVLGSGAAVRTTRSIGGGNTSRLAKMCDDNAGAVHSAHGVSYNYSDVGLVGAVATAAAGASSVAAMEAVAGSLKQLSAGVPEDECARAKARVKGALMAEMDCGASLMTHIAEQVLATGDYATVAQQLAAIDAVTAAEVSSVAAAALKAAPACATVGDTASMPRYNKLANIFA